MIAPFWEERRRQARSAKMDRSRGDHAAAKQGALRVRECEACILLIMETGRIESTDALVRKLGEMTCSTKS